MRGRASAAAAAPAARSGRALARIVLANADGALSLVPRFYCARLARRPCPVAPLAACLLGLDSNVRACLLYSECCLGGGCCPCVPHTLPQATGPHVSTTPYFTHAQVVHSSQPIALLEDVRYFPPSPVATTLHTFIAVSIATATHLRTHMRERGAHRRADAHNHGSPSGHPIRHDAATVLSSIHRRRSSDAQQGRQGDAPHSCAPHARGSSPPPFWQ